MAKNGLKLIDAEMHVMEPVDLWQRYIEAIWGSGAENCRDHEMADARSLELQDETGCIRDWQRAEVIRSCLRDQPYSDVERKVGPDPAKHDRKPIAYADQEKDVHGAPKPPCRRTGDLHPSKIRNRTPAADRGQAALVSPIARPWTATA